MTRLLTEPDLRQRIGHAARLRYLDRFGIDTWVDDAATLISAELASVER